MFGRGRGRGRGGRGGRSMTPAALRNEVGDAAAAELERPPQLYPELELPVVQDLDSEGTQLLGYWRHLGHLYKSSCYHLTSTDAKRGPINDDPYASLSRAKAAVNRAPLSSVLTLDKKYFPEELFSATEKRASVRASSTKAFQSAGGTKDIGADLFERFAKLESGANAEEGRAGKRRAGGAAGAGEEGAKEGEGDEDEEQLQADDDDEAFQEDDDYLMTEAFDDDEGYDDPYGDGDDEGPTY
ncbi:hypothetical protein COCOBI_04-3610 [Coccomyxa sp. Obi]|nr:hypothetical protein COCOBI_04-3610 [Coccomyxa sp. Obi]